MSTDQLIAIVKQHPILYDSNHAEFKNVRIKDEVWADIAAELKSDAEAIKKKWKNIRDSYTKYLKCCSGTTSKKNYRHWQWAKAMDPLRPFLCGAKYSILQDHFGEGSNTSSDQFMDETDVQTLSPEFVNSDSLPEESKPDITGILETPTIEDRVAKISSEEIVDKKTQLQNENASNQIHITLDDIELIFLGYAKTIKSFSAKRRVITKMKIAQIMMEQELEHLEEVAGTTSSEFN